MVLSSVLSHQPRNPLGVNLGVQIFSMCCGSFFLFFVLFCFLFLFCFGGKSGSRYSQEDDILAVTLSHVGDLAKAISVVPGQRLTTALAP